MFTKKIQSSRANGNINPIIYHNDSNGYNTDRFPKQQDSRQINSNFNQRKTFTSGQFTQFKKIQPQKNTELVIRQCDPSQLNMRKNIGRQSEDLAPNYQFGSSKKQMISIGSRKKYDSNMKQPMVQIHFSDRENSQRRSSQFQHNSSQVQVLTEELLKLNDYVKDNFSRFNFQIYQSTLESKKAAKMAQSVNVNMTKVVAAVNQNLANQKKQINEIRNLQNQSHNQIQSLKNSFFDFVKEQEQKMQNMVLDGSMKRSKHFDQFGVDLKSSSQCLGGIGASMSVNFGGQNLNLKLYNQLSIQLETFKSQLQDCKQKIHKLSVQRRFQNETLQKQEKPNNNNNNNNNNVMSVQLQLCEIEKIISQKLIEFKKNLNLNQKFTQIQTKLHYLSIQKHNQESNIKGMNEQFNRVLNTVIIPRQKAIEQKVKICEQSIKKISEKEQTSIKNFIQPQVKAHIQKQLEKTKILKVRSQNKKEEQTLALMNCQNQSQNSSQIYMLDQNNYLVDSRGYYLVENNTQESGIECKKKIKIQEDLLYLLEVNGMQITTVP